MTADEQALIFARNIVRLWNEYSDKNSEESDSAMRDTFKAVVAMDLGHVEGVLASPLNYFARAYLFDENPEDLTFAEMTDSLEISIRLLEEENRPDDFCRHCGASIPPRPGEGTCQECDPRGGACRTH